MRTQGWFVLLVVAVGVTAFVTRAVVGKAATPGTAIAPVGTLKEIMEGIVDPSSDVIFESVAVVSNAAGTEERAPKTADDWAAVEHAALTLAEGANLVKMERPVARPGESNAAGNNAADPSGRGAPELSPDQIRIKIAADRTKFDAYANALLASAVEVIKAAQARNVAKLYELGGDLDQACENCHLEYWYPDQARPAKAKPVGPPSR